MTEVKEKRRLVYVPSSGSNQAGNNIFTRLKNAANKVKRSYWNRGKNKGYVTEYELVPTGRRFNNEGELMNG